MPLVDATDLRWSRQRRATVKALSGLLDVVLPPRVGDGGPTLLCAPPAAVRGDRQPAVEVACRHQHMLLPEPPASIGTPLSDRPPKTSGY